MAIVVRDHRGGNWFWIHNVILDEYGKVLGAYGLAVYMTLCRHAGQEQSTWVGQKNIAEEIGSSRTQVQRELTKLKDLGLLAIEEQVDDRGRTTNIYTMLSPPAKSAQASGPTADHPSPSQVHGGTTPVLPLPQCGASLPIPGASMKNKTHGTRPMEQDPATAMEILWQVTLTDLAEQIVPVNYDRWLARTRLLQRVDGAVVVGVPDQICADQLARRFDPLVRRALADALGEAVAVRYQVMEG